MLSMLVAFKSTVEILVIPPFLAADWILASASKKRIPKKPVALEVPTLFPTGLDVALTGRVKEQLANITATAANANTDLIFLNILD